MKRFFLIILLFACVSRVYSQTISPQAFYYDYHIYRETSLEKKEFKPEKIYSVINKFNKKGSSFHIDIIGHSLLNRPIYLINYGSGPIKVLLWSQMHGDESTATMALMDIFNFLNANDNYNQFRNFLKQRLSVFFIPMLNPDGDAKFNRRNALQIDINRDARRLQFPESRILKTVRDSLKPTFGFNLHDQQKYYSVGRSFRPATISFLAPAFNYKDEVNPVRARTMKLIADVARGLSNIIPGHIGRYNDEFEPRAFGDNFERWGTSSVLIESGGWKDDENKQFVRELNFIAILYALQSIASGEYSKFTTDEYYRIPENKKLLFDVIFRNVQIEFKKKNYLIDVAVNRKEIPSPDFSKTFYKSNVEDVGDLSTFYGYEEYDCNGMKLRKAKIFDDVIPDLKTLNELPLDSLYLRGVAFVRVANMPDSIRFTRGINILQSNSIATALKLNKPANFIITKGNKIIFTIVNGFVFDCISKRGQVKNGLILKN